MRKINYTALRIPLFLLLLIFFSGLLSAQVRIRERIELNPLGYKVPDKINSGGSFLPSWYRAQWSGTYLTKISLQARNQAPPYGPLTVMFRDSLRDTTMIFDVEDCILSTDTHESSYDVVCRPYETVFYNWHSAYSFIYDTKQHNCFRIPYVLKGDTIKLSYSNWDEVPTTIYDDTVKMAIRDPEWVCHSYDDGSFQDIYYCGVDLISMGFYRRRGDWEKAISDTLILGSSEKLTIACNDDRLSSTIYPQIYDSLMTIEVDSPQYAKIIYDRGSTIDTLDSPADSIKYSDACWLDRIKFFATGKRPDKPVPVRICARLMSDSSRVFEDTIFVKGADILLGETKYYYATSADNKLTIHETTLPELPSGDDVVRTDIWGDNPVEVVITDPEKSGKIMGVYWEKKYPIYKADTLDTLKTVPTGMIRLVGRYWHKDSIYIVNLVTGDANYGIKIEEPAKLGNSVYATNRRYSRDVFNNPINIDSICIFYGGIYGIPPQLIKGQMEKESRYVSNFGFSPAYRYEPYTAQFWDGIRNRTNNPFFITISIRTPEPPEHGNVKDINYFTDTLKVWNVIVNHSQLVDNINDDAHKLYGKRGDTMDFSPYSRPMNIYHGFLSHYKDELGLDLEAAADSARNKMIEYLRDKWDYNVPRNRKGLNNVRAQTRIASSYGLLQPMYTTALDFGYQENVNYLPELLNITDTSMVVSMKFQKKKLREYVGVFNEEKNNSWDIGYEYCFLRGVYPNWNSIVTYPNKIFKFSRNYQPKK